MDYFIKSILTLASCLTAFTSFAGTTFTVESNTDGSHRIVLSSDEVSDVKAAQALISERANEVCGDQFVVLGRYEFSKKESLNAPDNQEAVTFELDQELTCEDEPIEQSRTEKNSDVVFVADDQLKQQAMSAFDTYKGLLNKKKYKTAYEMLTAVNQNISPYKRWKKDKQAFRKSVGGAGEFVDLKLTWYKDPPNAAGPGIYVAFDYGCVYPNLELCSGVLIFHQDESGEFKVIREETNMMDKEAAASMSEVNFSVRPHQTAGISSEQWANYYQLATIKYSGAVYSYEDKCTTQVAAKDINANIYFTQPCHSAHPAWVTIYVIEENQHLRLGQIGYFAGSESAFAEMYKAYGVLREQMIEDMRQPRD
ncbi:hypothetical protein OS175_13310 [Marinicella sp. S1101]|uniref:hypothetical protein n=1 Tax=Marinicella marina TaxID=2996016 RepID=UPI002260814F|nr:hypothetical protein [Marinicella marina]MCX7554852.1 hypothetical protein [Marinicella marina]MDJ1141510.1 hypothetical protein [Marinicella marina]